MRPVVLGTETGLGRALTASIPRRADPIDLTGPYPLGATIALLRRAALFIGNDSGLAHVAEAVGTPSAVVYGASHPHVWGPIEREWHRPVSSVTSPCRAFLPCGCPDASTIPCLDSVTADDLLREARSLISTIERVTWLSGYRAVVSFDSRRVTRWTSGHHFRRRAAGG